jgi:type VI secretion system protein ImpC
MTAKSWSLRIGDINLTSGADADLGPVSSETPFRILVLADFSGQARKAGRQPLSQRKSVLVDRDNFEDALARADAEVTVTSSVNRQEQIVISFRAMEDFESDQLFQRLDVFETLRTLRRRLHSPAQFAAATAEIRSWAAADKIPAVPATTPAAVSEENLLEQILGQQDSIPREGLPGASDWSQFLQKIVQPYVVSRPDPRLPDFEAVLDEAISAQMRSVLHHADFQELEAAWRGLSLLVHRLETDAKLKLYFLDANKAELANDLVGVSDLGQTAMYRHLVKEAVGTPGAQPWAIVVGGYTFGPTTQDVEVLANMARIARAARAPFIAGAHTLLLGCSSLVTSPDPHGWRDDPLAQGAWQQVRQLPEAAFLGLALPRLLLRVPYGKNAATTEQFGFEEMPAGAPHDNYLWGNPAFACALLLGQSFSQSGWNLRPGELSEIDRLPVAIYQEEDERLQKPCAEVLLTSRAIDEMLNKGFIPLLSQKGRDAVRLGRFQSVASPPTPLGGRWQ